MKLERRNTTELFSNSMIYAHLGGFENWLSTSWLNNMMIFRKREGHVKKITKFR